MTESVERSLVKRSSPQTMFQHAAKAGANLRPVQELAASPSLRGLARETFFEGQ